VDVRDQFQQYFPGRRARGGRGPGYVHTYEEKNDGDSEESFTIDRYLSYQSYQPTPFSVWQDDKRNRTHRIIRSPTSPYRTHPPFFFFQIRILFLQGEGGGFSCFPHVSRDHFPRKLRVVRRQGNFSHMSPVLDRGDHQLRARRLVFARARPLREFRAPETESKQNSEKKKKKKTKTKTETESKPTCF
jgi:hypothetical protein